MQKCRAAARLRRVEKGKGNRVPKCRTAKRVGNIKGTHIYPRREPPRVVAVNGVDLRGKRTREGTGLVCLIYQHEPMQIVPSLVGFVNRLT